MNKRAINYLACFILLSSLYVEWVAAKQMEDPGHLDLGPIEMTPLVTVGVGYDDNVYRQGSGVNANKGSAVYKLDGSLAFKAQKNLSTYDATIAVRNTVFSGESIANYTDYGLSGKLHEELNSRNRFDVDFDFGQYHNTGYVISDTNLEAPGYLRTNAGLRYGLGSMEAMFRMDMFGSYKKVNYDEANGIQEGNDRTSSEYGGAAYYRIMPKTEVLLEIKERELDYPDTNNNDGYNITSILMGLNWEATGKTTGYAKAGHRKRDAQATNIASDDSTGWEIGVSYTPVEHSVIQFSTTKDYGFNIEDPNATNPLFTYGSTYFLSWDHQWSSKISSHTNYRFTKEDIENSSNIVQKDRKINEIGLSLGWSVLHNVVISASYDYTKQDETNRVNNAGASNYTRHAYMLGVDVGI